MQERTKRIKMTFKNWVDEFFSNSSVDLEILYKAYNALVPKDQQISGTEAYGDEENE